MASPAGKGERLATAIRLLADDPLNRSFRLREVWRQAADLTGKTPRQAEQAVRRSLRGATWTCPVPESHPDSREFLCRTLDDLFPDDPLIPLLRRGLPGRRRQPSEPDTILAGLALMDLLGGLVPVTGSGAGCGSGPKSQQRTEYPLERRGTESRSPPATRKKVFHGRTLADQIDLCGR